MGVINSTKAMAIRKQKESKEAARVSSEKYSKIEDCPDPSDPNNFTEWIKYQKQNWRKMRNKLKQGNSMVRNNQI
jgi:hypothetical protein